MNESNLIVPKGLYFDKTHTWAFMEKDGTVKVGIDDFLQHVTGAITSIKMKKPGEKIKKGEHILTIVQNGKRLNICAPLSGIIQKLPTDHWRALDLRFGKIFRQTLSILQNNQNNKSWDLIG
ncbi:MAG: hypothetical protein NTV01_02940 [Bacteroidia bacterium]|nr:hypothetical protein [Bacteroidia bacterium]